MRRRAGERRQPKQTRRNKDRFLMLTEPMLDSPALRVLSLGALRVLFRISLEHLRHNRQNNGNLLVTYEDFVAYGLHRHAVAPAIRELRKLGFIAITRQGGGGNAEHHS